MSLNVALLDADISNVAFLVVSSPLVTAIEALRRSIHEQNGDNALADSLLTSVHIGVTSYMHIFRISNNVELDLVNELDLSQVNVVESSSFASHDLVFPAFPATSLCSVVTNFLAAVRNAIIERVARQPSVLSRLKAGFLISYTSSSNEWSAPWVIARPYSFCYIQVHLVQSRLVVHPLIIPTSFVPLSPSLPAGTSISLLPFGISAYYLTSYRGPTSALSRQFQESFVGLGVHSWNREEYIIAWIVVENRQGEDKGLSIIYPKSLCVHSTSCNHPPLSYIPTLPATLQSSPQLAGSPIPAMSVLSLSSPTLSAYRTLTSSKSRDVPYIAKEVGAYVDAVARERERERERLKKEREGGSTSASRTPSQSLVTHPEPTPQTQLQAPPPPSSIPTSPFQPMPIPSQQHNLPMSQAPVSFYPSPPQSNTVTQSSSMNNVHAPPVVMPSVPMNAMDIDPQPVQSSSFNGFDSNWMDSFLSFDATDAGDGNSGGTSMMMGMGDFEADFTEDDFSFFDAKPTGGANGIVGLAPAEVGSSDDASMWGIATGFGMDTVSTHDHSHIHIMPTPGAVTDGLPTPLPELASPVFRAEATTVLTEDKPYNDRDWDAIPFAGIHKDTDGKYSAGKFMSGLASPPYEPDGWYKHKTDPSVGVVKRLKRMKIDDSSRQSASMSSDDWEREWEETRDDDAEIGEEESDEDMEEESDGDDDTEGVRPSTPLPVYLPLGPALLPLQFKHEYMLPMSVPLRSAGGGNGIGTGNGVGTGVSSVPTPVSPGRGGKGRVLEATAESLAREIVENGVWAETWNELNVDSCGGASVLAPGPGPQIWDREAQSVSELFASVKGLKAPVGMEELFGLESSTPSPDSRFEKLEPPNFVVGKGDAVIQVSPPAIRFWEKLGLGPRSGRKDVQAFVAFDSLQEDLSPRIVEWLAFLKTVYESKHFGKIAPGQSDFCDDGVVHMRYDSSIRKSFDAFINGLPIPPARTHIVVFIVTPLSTMLLKSTAMRQLFAVIRKASRSEPHVVFQLIAEKILRTEYTSCLGTLCLSLFNRIPVPVVRSMSRKLFQAGEVKKYLEDPAFVLARTLEESRITFSPQRMEQAASVVDAGTFLHVAYAVSECGRWLLVSCVDQRGEGHDMGVWLTIKGGGGGDSDAEVDDMLFLVSKVWEFASRFSKRANIEWRIAIAKLGSMDKGELDAWISYLDNGAFEPTETGPVHVSIIAVEPSTPWMFTMLPEFSSAPPPSLKSVGRSASVSSKNVYVDVASTTYALYQQCALPVSVPPTAADLGLDLHHIPDPSPVGDSGPGSPLVEPEHDDYPHRLPLVPHASATLIRTVAAGGTRMLHIHLLHTIRSVGCVFPASDHHQLMRDLARSYYALSVLTSAKGGGGTNTMLPYHLGAVKKMKNVVALSDSANEGADS